MGIFFDSTPTHEHLKNTISTALRTATPDDKLEATADRMATRSLKQSPARLKWGRFWGAVGILAVLITVGGICESLTLDTAAGALFGMATTIFGVVVAFVSSEKPRT